MGDAIDAAQVAHVVVVAVDKHSPVCEAAFHKAAALLDKETTTFHIIHVRHAKEEVLLAPMSEGLERYNRELEMQRQQASKKVLDRFRTLAEEAKLKHEVVELCPEKKHGLGRDVREVICNYCQQVGADLLVVGSRTGRLATMLMGSVSSYCAHHAPCAVMIERHSSHGHDSSASPGSSSRSEHQPGA